MKVELPAGGTVRGVGIDLIECARIARVLERQKDRFLKRVFTEAEQAYCMRMKNPVPHLAARFAAKEAVSKCFTTGIGRILGWRSIEVVKGQREEPWVRLDGPAAAFLREIGGTEILLSMAHTEVYGTAVALLVAGPPEGVKLS